MMELIQTTKQERDIMRHALGLTSKDEPKKGDSNRNYFSTGPGSSDYAACQDLVAKGCMTVRKHPFCEDYLFYVTETGKAELSLKSAIAKAGELSKPPTD